MSGVPTIHVQILATGQGPVTINEADFREELHERWVHLRPEPAEALPTPTGDGIASPVEEAPPAPLPGKKRKG